MASLNNGIGATANSITVMLRTPYSRFVFDELKHDKVVLGAFCEMMPPILLPSPASAKLIKTSR